MTIFFWQMNNMVAIKEFNRLNVEKQRNKQLWK